MVQAAFCQVGASGAALGWIGEGGSGGLVVGLEQVCATLVGALLRRGGAAWEFEVQAVGEVGEDAGEVGAVGLLAVVEVVGPGDGAVAVDVEPTGLVADQPVGADGEDLVGG